MRVRRPSDDALQRFGCRVLACGLALPTRLQFKDWAAVGRELGKQQTTLRWCIGDWWNYPGHSYGDRTELVEAEDWDGPAYSTCANVGTTAKAFELSRRRESLSFGHHTEVAHLSPRMAGELLDWCEQTAGGRPRSIRALREEIKRRLTPESAPSFGSLRQPTVALTIAPASPQEEQHVVRPAAGGPLHEPEVRDHLGKTSLGETSADREAVEIARAGLSVALGKAVSADLREQLLRCLKILASS
jgi:hypothetical protein